MKLTVGPLPAAVYWRRRAVVLAGVLIVVLLTIYSCGTGSDANPAGRDAKRSASPSAVIYPSDDPSSEAPPDDGGDPRAPGDGYGPGSGSGSGSSSGTNAPPCADSDIKVVPKPAHTETPEGARLRINLEITNVSDRACKRDVGVYGLDQETYSAVPERLALGHPVVQQAQLFVVPVDREVGDLSGHLPQEVNQGGDVVEQPLRKRGTPTNHLQPGRFQLGAGAAECPVGIAVGQRRAERLVDRQAVQSADLFGEEDSVGAQHPAHLGRLVAVVAVEYDGVAVVGERQGVRAARAEVGVAGAHVEDRDVGTAYQLVGTIRVRPRRTRLDHAAVELRRVPAVQRQGERLGDELVVRLHNHTPRA